MGPPVNRGRLPAPEASGVSRHALPGPIRMEFCCRETEKKGGRTSRPGPAGTPGANGCHPLRAPRKQRAAVRARPGGRPARVAGGPAARCRPADVRAGRRTPAAAAPPLRQKGTQPAVRRPRTGRTRAGRAGRGPGGPGCGVLVRGGGHDGADGPGRGARAGARPVRAGCSRQAAGRAAPAAVIRRGAPPAVAHPGGSRRRAARRPCGPVPPLSRRRPGGGRPPRTGP